MKQKTKLAEIVKDMYMKMMTDKAKIPGIFLTGKLDGGYIREIRTAPPEEMFMKILRIEKALM